MRICSLLLFFFFQLIAFDSRAQTFAPYSVVIDEIMADPTPQVGLPNIEWIELKNASSVAINLQGWRIGDAGGMSGPMPDFILVPDSFVIICTGNAVAAMSSYGKTISVTSFPSINNDGEILFLVSAQGNTIHAVNYSVAWYQNAVKAEGGWSLEMIDTKNPCSGISNWKASIAAAGGSPGKKNSIDGPNMDTTPPQLKRSFTLNDRTLILLFDEPLDSASAGNPSRYTINNNISVSAALPVGPLFNTVQLSIATPLQNGTIYTTTVTNIKDCQGNEIGVYNQTKTGVAQEALANDVVINEILFNPKPIANDYVEFYNRSNKIIDVGKLLIANRNTSGNIASLKKLSETPLFIFPGEYVVVTEDAINLSQNYFVKSKDAIIVLSSLPSFPDDKGTAVLLNGQGAVVDEVKYTDDWHFDLIANPEGVALERIDPAGLSQDKNNWHSASSTAGYGTPGYPNSQYKQSNNNSATIEITPKVFSPDNDGFNDISTISYAISENGYAANVIIFDAGGRQIRHLVKNALLGLKGSWNWDGLGENGQRIPIGSYIIYTELFNLDGKKERFKNVVVLGRRLN